MTAYANNTRFHNNAAGYVMMKGKKDHPYFAYYFDMGERVSLGRFKTIRAAEQAVCRFLAKGK